MRKFLLLCCAFSIAAAGVAQNYNMQLRSNKSYNVDLNDIWGMNHSSGKEYAIVGRVNGISIVDVTNPDVLTEIYSVDGVFSIWRDLKSFGDFAYGVTEAREGITIIDLRNAPTGSIQSKVYRDEDWSSSHNFFIDQDNGRMYVFGANYAAGKLGVLVYDLNNDPYNPTFVGFINTPYCHDGFARGDNLYLANINDGFLSIYNIADLNNVELLSVKSTPKFFTHNIWTNDAQTVAYTTDEKSGAGITSYDISDKTNPIFRDNIESDPEIKPIVHNAHAIGGFVVTSYYSNGITIHDGTVPSKLAEVAYFDTSPFRNNNFNGAWGAYPFLNSGNILASDIEKGLFVLTPTYVTALDFNGEVVDKATGASLSNVTISIDKEGHNVTDWAVAGGFNDRLAAGSYTFTVSKSGYITKTVAVASNAGQFPFTRIELEKTSTGIEGYDSDAIKVNNSNGVVVVNSNVELTAVEIYNAQGQWMATSTQQNGVWKSDALRTGVYVVKATNGSQSFTKKIVIN